MCQQEMEVEVTDVDEDNELGGEAGDQGRLSCVDCALQAPRREIHSNDVCGDPMDLAINMVIGSDDCFIGDQGKDEKKPPPVGIADEPYFSPRDKHRQKHQRRKVIFYNPRILLIIISHRAVGNRAIHYVYSPSIVESQC